MFTSLSRAKEVTNGVMEGDTPPEDDLGVGDDDINADSIDHDLQDEHDDSLDTRKLSPDEMPKLDPPSTLKHSQSVNSSISSSISTGSISNQRLDPEGGATAVPVVGATNVPVGGATNVPVGGATNGPVGGGTDVSVKKSSATHLRHSKSYERGTVGGAEGTSVPKHCAAPLIFVPNSFIVPSSSSTAPPPPSSSSQRQPSKRSKERIESTRSRGSRQASVRPRAQSRGREVHVPASPGSGAGGSSVIKVSSSAGAVGGITPTNSPRKGRKEDGWKEVGRR